MIKFTKEEKNIISKYLELAELNPGNENIIDKIVYVFVKIMFEHPLVDGNKRLACRGLLGFLEVPDDTIDLICKSLAKEVR